MNDALGFSFRTVLIAITALVVVLGLKVMQVEQQKAAVAWVIRNRGTVRFDYEVDEDGTVKGGMDEFGCPITSADLPGPVWLRESIGVEYMAAVVDVSLSADGVSDLAPLAVS